MALTDRQLKALRPEAKSYTVSDGGGLSIEVSPKGGKWWRFRYRYDGKAKKASLGVYPDVSLSEARNRRDRSRTLVSDGVDPFPSKKKMKEQQVQQQSMEKTFREWTDFYISKVKDDVSEAHLERSIKGWNKDVFPLIGDMPMNDIEAKHIISIMHVMDKRGVKESAKKVFSSISRVFQVAIANHPDEVRRNPTKDILLKDILGKRVVKHYPIITAPKELGALLIAIDEYQGHDSTRLALKMIAHTAVRPFNIRHAEWSEIDVKAKQWVIPAKKMKTKKELIVPLSTQVIEILDEAKALSGNSKLLFPAPKSVNSPLSDASMVGALRRLGYTKDEIVAHSFRGIFSTILHEVGDFSHEAIETQLAHSVGSNVSQAYNRAKYLPERVQMMQWYSDHLEGVTHG